MRILVISNLYPPRTRGGYETECATVVESMAETHEVRVLTSHGPGPTPADSTTIIRALPLSGYSMHDSLLAPFRSIRGAKIMRRQLAEFRPDVVWIWNGAAVPHAVIRIAEQTAPAVVWRICERWFAGLYSEDLYLRYLRGEHVGLRRPWAWLARLVNRHPALRIELEQVVSAAISWNSESLRATTPVPSTVQPTLQRTIYPATRQETLLALVERHPAPRPLVAFLGRLEPPKGPDIAVAALAELAVRHGITADLVLAGPAERSDRRRLLRLAAKLGVRDRVQLTGPLDTDGVAGLFSRAHVVVVPAIWEEPFGLVPIEAAAAGVPVVASRSGGLVEGLREPDEALFFPIGDASACASAVADTLTNESATADRVARARAPAGELGIDRYLAETAAFFAEAVGPSSAPD